jgi:FHS family L-fucose permease-like MFS transporter
LDTVQWVYLAVACLGVVLNILFYFCNLPEIEEESVLKVQINSPDGTPESFWKQYRCLFGFVAQTAYVGAQVGVATLAVNFMVEQNIGINQSRASQLFSFCQMTFTFGRFVGTLFLNFVDPALLLSIYGVACSVFSLSVAFATGKAGVGCLFALFFFESICYPCIFTLGTKNLGMHTKHGSGLIVMGVGGGAWYPPAQASVADKISTRRSYLVPLSGFIAMTLYAIGLAIDQASKDGFRFRNHEEMDSGTPTEEETGESDEKKGSIETAQIGRSNM